MFYLCFYIWMTQNTEREAGGGRGDEYRWFLCMPGSAERRRGQNGACHSNVRHLFNQWGRRDNAGDSWWQRQLVVPLAPACDPLWGDTSAQKKKRKVEKKKDLWRIKTAGQTPCLRQQETNATRTPGWHVRQYLLCHSAPLLLLPPSICPSSSLHQPASGHWGLSAKPSNLSTLSFLSPQIWIWKGTLSYPVKDHHFNDIWQSFDLLGFRGRGEEIH